MPELEKPALATGMRVVLSDEAVDLLRQVYDIGDWLAWERAPQGHSNHSFFVTASSGEYVLRRSTPRNRAGKPVEAIKFEVRLIEHLRERGYPAPRVVSTRSGEQYVEHGGTLYLMTGFIAGGAYDAENPAHLLAAGECFGRYHRLARTLAGPYYASPSYSRTILEPRDIGYLDNTERLLEPFLGADQRGRLRSHVSYLRGQFASIPQAISEVYPGLSRQVIHGSFGVSCLIFAGDELAGVLDYDRARLEARVTDLAIAIRSFCRAGENGDGFWAGLDPTRCRAFLAAYREVEPLSEEELEALPLIVREQHLMMKVLKRCTNFLARSPGEQREAERVQKLARRLEQEAVRLRWLEAHGEDLVAALMG